MGFSFLDGFYFPDGFSESRWIFSFQMDFHVQAHLCDSWVHSKRSDFVSTWSATPTIWIACNRQAPLITCFAFMVYTSLCYQLLKETRQINKYIYMYVCFAWNFSFVFSLSLSLYTYIHIYIYIHIHTDPTDTKVSLFYQFVWIMIKNPPQEEKGRQKSIWH